MQQLAMSLCFVLSISCDLRNKHKIPVKPFWGKIATCLKHANKINIKCFHEIKIKIER